MTNEGRYADERTFALPENWTRATDEVLRTASEQTLAALTDAGVSDAVAAYYDRDGGYAGTLFLDASPNDPLSIEASDLYAVTTLSITLDARYGRLLLGPGDVRRAVLKQLEGLDPSLPVTDLEHGAGGSAETLSRMWELHHRLKTLIHDGSNRWVTAAKLCARKRPRLFPVRDNLVCVYLGGGEPLRAGNGRPGNFSVDIQVYAHLMTDERVKSALSWLRNEVTGRGTVIDTEDLRLLDAALWMHAARRSRSGAGSR
jgi:hypothetical protein